MAHRRSPLSRISSFESLEPRNLMSAITTIPMEDTSAEVRDLLHPSADVSLEAQWAKGEGEASPVEAEMQPREVYSSDQKQEFWEGIRAGQDATINEGNILLSAADVTPSKDSPLAVETDFVMDGRRGGLMILTRTDGVAGGRFRNEYATGLSFGVSYHSAIIYLADPSGNRYISNSVKFPEQLSLGVRYTVAAYDNGDTARLVVSRDGMIIAEVSGAVPQPARAPKVVVRSEESGGEYRMHLKSLRVMHGVEPVQRPAAPKEQSDIVDAAKGKGRLAEVETQPREVYNAAQKQAFWEDIPEGKDLTINDRVQVISRGEVLPTPESPVIFKTQFTLGGKKSGITLITRTDGVTSGRFNNEFRNGLSFRAEYNVACIYFSDPVGGELIGIPVEFPERLQLGVPYDFLVEDRGTEAHLALSQNGTVLADIRGAIPRAASEPRTVFRRTEVTDDFKVHISGTTLSHGMEPVSQAAQEHVPEEPTAPAVDAIFSDAEIVRQLLLEHMDIGDPEVPDQSHILYTSDAKQEFWQELREGQGINLNDLRQYTSREEIMPTPDRPVRVTTDFSFAAGDAGLIVVTRTDGVAGGRFINEYAGLSFSVSYNNATVYLRGPSGGKYIGASVTFPQHLQPGKLYTLTVEDLGTEARLTISCGGEIVAAIRGAVPSPADPADPNRLVFRANSTRGPQVKTPSITVMHGEGGEKAIDAIFSEEGVLEMLTKAEAAEAGKLRLLTSDDPRLAVLQGTNYENNYIAELERDRLYRESRFFVQEDIRTIARRNPLYGGNNANVSRDIEVDLERLLGAYRDVVGDALLRGIGVEIADLKSEPNGNAMAALDHVLGQRARGRYIIELARGFQIGMPSKNEILAESRILLAQNVDRLIGSQAASAKAVAEQNWRDTQKDAPRKEKDPTERRQVEANKERLKEAMVKTAPIIQKLGADVRREFEAAVAKSPFSLQEIYVLANVPYPQVVSRENYAEAGTPDSEVLGKSSFVHEAAPGATTVIKNGELIGSESMRVPAELSQTKRYSVDREVMANFWVNSVPGRAVSLTISGGSLPANGYSSDHGLGSAGSTSLKLTPGTYEVTVTDKTNYGVMPNGNDLRSRPLKFPLHMDVRPWNMREIVGRVSIEGREEALPMSMKVAEFYTDTGKRKENYEAASGKDAITKLDPNYPVGIVIHGRNDSEDSGKIEELTKALTEFAAHEAKGIQIVTVDWSEAAKNFNSINPNAWDISNSDWVQAAGEWLGRRLLELGFSPDQISGWFHSHANGFGFHMANFLKQQTGQKINLFIALDPAKNPGLAGGSAAYDKLDIGSVSTNSVAFDSSWLGSSHFSGTANRSFLLQTETNDVDPTNGVIDKYVFRNEDVLKHGAGLETVASMIRSLIHGNATPFDPADLRKILSGIGDIGVRANTLAGDEQPLGSKVYEGQIVIRTELKVDAEGDKWLKGTPISFQYIDAITGRAERTSISGLKLKDHDGMQLGVGAQDQSWLGDINQKNEYVFQNTSNRRTELRFSLPKPGTMFRVIIEPIDGNGFPEEFVVDNEHTVISLLTHPETYKITLSQIASSQHHIIGGSATDADMPYTLSIF